MGEQMPDPDRLAEGFGDRLQRGTAAIDAHIGKGWDKAAYRILEFESAFLVEHHRRHGSDGFSHRVNAEQSIALDGCPGFRIPLAV